MERPVPPFVEQNYLTPYYIAIGKLVLRGTGLHDVFCRLFLAMQDPTGTASIVPLASWNTVNSDRTQREMLKAAIAARFSSDDDFRDRLPSSAEGDLAWLTNQAQSIEDDRNNAVHSPLGVTIVGSGLGFVPWD